MFETRLTRLLGIEVPIIQGGLQWIATARLASAVSEAGALGMLAGLSFPDRKALRNEIRRTRELTKKPFGVNLSMLPELTQGERTEEILQVVLDKSRIQGIDTNRDVPAPMLEELFQHLRPGLGLLRGRDSILHIDDDHIRGRMDGLIHPVGPVSRNKKCRSYGTHIYHRYPPLVGCEAGGMHLGIVNSRSRYLLATCTKC